MLTCWGTDSSDSDDDDEEDSDPVVEKEDAEDGDGEWEDGSSSDDDDDDNQVARRATHGDLNGHMVLDGFPGTNTDVAPAVGASPSVQPSANQRIENV